METTEAPTREMDVATVVAALDRLAPVAQRRVAKQALGRLLAPEERDPYVVLAEARKVLGALHDEKDDLARNATTPTFAYRNARAAEACERGQEGVFNALNVLTHWLNDERAFRALGASDA